MPNSNNDSKCLFYELNVLFLLEIYIIHSILLKHYGKFTASDNSDDSNDGGDSDDSNNGEDSEEQGKLF